MTNVTTSAIIVPGDKTQASRPVPLDQSFQRILPRPPGAGAATTRHRAFHVQGGALDQRNHVRLLQVRLPSDATVWRKVISRENQKSRLHFVVTLSKGITLRTCPSVIPVALDGLCLLANLNHTLYIAMSSE